MKKRRGSSLVESALALMAFAILLAGIMETALVLFAANSVTFAAQRAVRYASFHGTANAATLSDVQSVGQAMAAPLSSDSVTVNVTWTPDHKPGSTVQVQVLYAFKPAILPLDGGVLTLQSTARAAILQ